MSHWLVLLHQNLRFLSFSLILYNGTSLRILVWRSILQLRLTGHLSRF
uniref:Uncharacterized protein n=1 Tax=Populus trichocarpa x Populus deltoides TaxID=3695 RepID=A9PK31_9ROSI|nr:unknown [Populus trichocarpa x Populus deltoides]